MTNKSIEIPSCNYPNQPITIPPLTATPNHVLPLSSLDDQLFLRFPIRYLYLFRKGADVEALKSSLARVLVDFYPLAGRLRVNGERVEVECNGQGALFAEGWVDGVSADEFLEGSRRPDRSWRKLLFRVEAQCFLDVPPLVVQVIHLNCGGMILCTAISHCLCDGIGTSQFLQSWAHLTSKPLSGPTTSPFHSRRPLFPCWPRNPTAVPHPEFAPREPGFSIHDHILQSQPLVPVSVLFSPTRILELKKKCVPSFKCTSFEALAAHVWRAWVKALDVPAAVRVKLLFSVNVRRRVVPELPHGYYGNGFVLACAESTPKTLTKPNPRHAVKLVQDAKDRVNDAYVRSVIDILDERRVRPDLSSTLVISQWSKLGLEELDFGEGRPVHMGPLASEIYCIFVPVIGDLHAVNVLVSVPCACAERFEGLLRDGECY